MRLAKYAEHPTENHFVQSPEFKIQLSTHAHVLDADAMMGKKRLTKWWIGAEKQTKKECRTRKKRSITKFYATVIIIDSGLEKRQ